MSLTRSGAVDISQNNAQEVREDTAELASWALSDKLSLSSGRSPARRSLPPNAPSTLPDNIIRADTETLDHHRSQSSLRPDAIPEVSEPASPGSMHSSRKSPGMSALSEMFRHTPPTEDESAATDDEDQLGNGSRLKPVTVQDAIISQPNERTALLLKKQVCGGDNRNGSIHDLESQKQGCLATSSTQIGNFLKSARERLLSGTTTAFSPKSWDGKAVREQALLKPATYVPAVILGLLLNILDALSYGMPDAAITLALLTSFQV
ncbi:MAG: hypothetical protein Q9208_000998 [Pyrenodesmia sp. 3 TL-2023]